MRATCADLGNAADEDRIHIGEKIVAVGGVWASAASVKCPSASAANHAAPRTFTSNESSIRKMGRPITSAWIWADLLSGLTEGFTVGRRQI